MNIVTKPTVLHYTQKYPISANSLLAWYKAFSQAAFNNFNELKAVYTNASILGNNRVIFNIKGNSFRLIVGIDFKRQAAYIIWFGTHKEYDKIDAATIAYVEV
jgi:mRNA interferase HigB